MADLMLGAFRKSVRKLADKEKIEPRQVSRAQYRASKLSPSHTTIDKRYGGFMPAIDRAFPPDKSPFTETENLDGHELSRFIANVIEDCAEALGMPPFELQWHEFRTWIKFRFGHNNQGIANHAITRAGGFAALRDAYFPPKPTKVVVEKKRLVDQANMNRKLGKNAADEQFVLEQIEHFCTKVFKKAFNIQVCCKQPGKSISPKRILNIVFSDLHFGSDIDAAETGAVTYGRVEESRRFAHVCKTLCEYKLDYRDDTELTLILNGDLIQNQLHDSRDGAVLAEQIARAIHILVQGISYICAHFPSVRIIVVPGNHDRNFSRHKGRAVHQKWDSYAFVIGTAIKYAIANTCKNATVEMPKTPFAVYDLFGKKALVTHGDGVINTGNIGSSIPIGSLESQINRLNASLPDSEEYAVVICGHIHVPSITHLGNGSVMITNGALVPVDPFAVSIGIPESSCGMQMFESTPGHPVGDTRLIAVGKEQDRDESLDQIISPWEYSG